MVIAAVPIIVAVAGRAAVMWRAESRARGRAITEIGDAIVGNLLKILEVRRILLGLGSLPGVGDVYTTLEGEGIYVGCKTTCSESAFLEIISDGTGTLTPGQGSVEIGFAGDQGKASILIAGTLELSGFTLDVTTNAEVGQ